MLSPQGTRLDFRMPTNEQMTWGVRNVLEEISDQVALA